jgi:hypothetical protein
MSSTDSKIDYQKQRELLCSFRQRMIPGVNSKLGIENQLDQLMLSTLSDSIDVSRPIQVSSHRKKMGWLIVFAKRIGMKLASPVIKILLKRQIALNEQVLVLAVHIVELKKQIRRLEKQIESSAGAERR